MSLLLPKFLACTSLLYFFHYHLLFKLSLFISNADIYGEFDIFPSLYG